MRWKIAIGDSQPTVAAGCAEVDNAASLGTRPATKRYRTMRALKVILGYVSLTLASMSGAIACLFIYLTLTDYHLTSTLAGTLAAVAALGFCVSGLLLLVKRAQTISATTRTRIVAAAFLLGIAVWMVIPTFFVRA